MPPRSFIVRRYVAARNGYVIDEATVVGLAEAKYSAEHLATHCAGAEVLDEDRRLVARFGRPPDE